MPTPALHLLALSEPATSAVFLTLFGILIIASALLSRTVDWLGIPVVLLFLILGMLGGSEGIGGLEFDSYDFAVRAGTLALVLILFDGGLNTSIASVRQVMYPAGLLATFGVAITAGVLAVVARLFGLSWPMALLLGAVVSSTDAAAVFAVLRGGRLQLEPRLARTLEVESCINDPMAMILTTTLIQIVQTGSQHISPLSLLLSIPLQLLIGTVLGVGFGYLGRMMLRRVRLTTTGLYPALTLALALLSFGVTTLVDGSGFLAVFVTGLILGDGTLPYRSGLTRVHDALGWLSQISMFLMMGLLVYPSRLLEVVWVGLGVGLSLAIIARPVAVLLCLLPFRYPLTHQVYLSWVGLRGAVPIILGTFPVLAGVPDADQLFHLVFFIVVISSIIPGSTIRWVTRRLRVDVPDTPVPVAVLEMNAMKNLDGEIISFHINPTLAVSGAKLSDVEFPSGASVLLVVRGNELLPARGETRLESGDHVYVFCRSNDRPFVELLFGGPEA